MLNVQDFYRRLKSNWYNKNSFSTQNGSKNFSHQYCETYPSQRITLITLNVEKMYQYWFTSSALLTKIFTKSVRTKTVLIGLGIQVAIKLGSTYFSLTLKCCTHTYLLVCWGVLGVIFRSSTFVIELIQNFLIFCKNKLQVHCKSSECMHVDCT